MVRIPEDIRSNSTSLTWEEKNPSSYLFDRTVLQRLDTAAQELRDEMEREEQE